MNKHILLILSFCFFLLPAVHASAESLQPTNWDADMKLGTVRDLNPDPNILEINLESRIAEVEIEPGRRVQAWTYDGGLPGPLIRLKVGDRLIVHFKNQLPQPTTVHWHGVRVPIEMDGVPGISQPEVKTGESFTYDFVVPDAGLFWYHPHVMSAAQVGFGLYGPLLVEDPNDGVGVEDELVMVISDIDISENGELGSAETGGTTGMAFGREGNIVLLNGRKNPVMTARSGAPQRWRVVNTAKTRYFKLDVGPGNNLTKIGGDGGLQEYPVEYEMLVLAPGERADLIVSPRGKPGSEILVIAQLHNRGYGSVEYRNSEELFRINVANLPEYRGTPMAKVGRAIQPMSSEGATPVSLRLNLTQDPRTLAFEYNINGKPYWKATSLPAKLGETQLWTVNNTTPWSHPLHIHGFFFQVLDKDGSPKRPLEWKDTVDVPLMDSVQLLVKFDDRPGTWMVHCHILDHAEGGLMTTVQVGDAPAGVHVHPKH